LSELSFIFLKDYKMSNFKLSSILLVLITLVVCPIGLQADDQPYPLEYWAKRSDISSVSLSPGGTKIALMKIPTADGMPVLEVYDADNLRAKPFKMDARPMEMTGFSWVSDNKILFNARLKVRDKIEGWNQGVYERAGGLLTIAEDRKQSTSKKIEEPFYIASDLPAKPNKILLGVYLKTSNYSRSNYERNPTFYEFDINTQRRQVTYKGGGKVNEIRFDPEGNPRFGGGYNGVTNSFETYYRTKGSSDWKIINARHREDFENWSPIGPDLAVPGNLLVRANNGSNTIGLWSFNPEKKTYDELIYKRSDVDVGVRRHTNPHTNPDEITAVSYRAGRETKYEWFNGEEKALYDLLKDLIPHSDRMRIYDRIADGSRMLVYNYGPKDPGTYYLIKDGEVSVVGSTYPQFSSDKLADAKVIQYKARDGRKINGYITVPNTEPPYPLVVMPHGGPFVSESSGYSPWAQFLANRGYMVLQPQYRGSKGYGLDFYTTAFINGSEGGFKMQDDKDDGALYLADQGLADRDRMMMFGWSYGGYAALVAASRTPQIYQCVVSGASVPDPNDQLSYYRNRMAQFPDRGSIEQVSFWDGAVSPIKEVAKVNVPMLVIHGDVDQRTPPRAARAYLKALEENNKEHKVVWLEGADHFRSTWFYDHKMQIYGSLINYLENDCFTEKQNLATN
jgi:dipeptidyl aminopeptidase/acylaminoacyl peptidase